MAEVPIVVADAQVTHTLANLGHGEGLYGGFLSHGRFSWLVTEMGLYVHDAVGSLLSMYSFGDAGQKSLPLAAKAFSDDLSSPGVFLALRISATSTAIHCVDLLSCVVRFIVHVPHVVSSLVVWSNEAASSSFHDSFRGDLFVGTMDAHVLHLDFTQVETTGYYVGRISCQNSAVGRQQPNGVDGVVSIPCWDPLQDLHDASSLQYAPDDGPQSALPKSYLRHGRVSVSSVTYMPWLNMLVVGYNFACFQLWCLGTHTLVYSSSPPEWPSQYCSSVREATFMQIPDDPGQGYLALVYGPTRRADGIHASRDHSTAAGTSLAIFGFKYHSITASLASASKAFKIDPTSVTMQFYMHLASSPMSTTTNSSPPATAPLHLVSCEVLQDSVVSDGDDDDDDDDWEEIGISRLLLAWEEEGQPSGSLPGHLHIGLFNLGNWFQVGHPHTIGERAQLEPAYFAHYGVQTNSFPGGHLPHHAIGVLVSPRAIAQPSRPLSLSEEHRFLLDMELDDQDWEALAMGWAWKGSCIASEALSACVLTGSATSVWSFPSIEQQALSTITGMGCGVVANEPPGQTALAYTMGVAAGLIQPSAGGGAGPAKPPAEESTNDPLPLESMRLRILDMMLVYGYSSVIVQWVAQRGAQGHFVLQDPSSVLAWSRSVFSRLSNDVDRFLTEVKADPMMEPPRQRVAMVLDMCGSWLRSVHAVMVACIARADMVSSTPDDVLLLSQYVLVLAWFVRHDLLPRLEQCQPPIGQRLGQLLRERRESANAPAAAGGLNWQMLGPLLGPGAGQFLEAFAPTLLTVANKLSIPALLIDDLADAIATAMPVVGTSTQDSPHYPPDSLWDLLAMFRQGHPDESMRKHCLVVYVLCDIAHLQKEGQKAVSSYSKAFFLPSAYQELLKGFWLLDNGTGHQLDDHTMSRCFLQPSMEKSWAWHVCKVLCDAGRADDAVAVLRSASLPVETVSDAAIALRCLVETGLIQEAFDLHRRLDRGASGDALMFVFLRVCLTSERAVSRLSQVAALNLDAAEERCLALFCTATALGPAASDSASPLATAVEQQQVSQRAADLLITYLLLRQRLAEAQSAHVQLRSAGLHMEQEGVSHAPLGALHTHLLHCHAGTATALDVPPASDQVSMVDVEPEGSGPAVQSASPPLQERSASAVVTPMPPPPTTSTPQAQQYSYLLSDAHAYLLRQSTVTPTDKDVNEGVKDQSAMKSNSPVAEVRNDSDFKRPGFRGPRVRATVFATRSPMVSPAVVHESVQVDAPGSTLAGIAAANTVSTSGEPQPVHASVAAKEHGALVSRYGTVADWARKKTPTRLRSPPASLGATPLHLSQLQTNSAAQTMKRSRALRSSSTAATESRVDHPSKGLEGAMEESTEVSASQSLRVADQTSITDHKDQSEESKMAPLTLAELNDDSQHSSSAVGTTVTPDGPSDSHQSSVLPVAPTVVPGAFPQQGRATHSKPKPVPGKPTAPEEEGEKAEAPIARRLRPRRSKPKPTAEVVDSPTKPAPSTRTRTRARRR